MGNPSTPPPIAGVLETSLYVADLDAATRFYAGTMGLNVMFTNERMAALEVAPAQVLLLFLGGASAAEPAEGGVGLPPHDGEGRLHLAFAVPRAALAQWEQRLEAGGIEIEQRVTWPRGGESVYFRDVDGHLVELATPGVWPNY